MTDVLLGNREIGTGYVGKEPGEYVVDVFRHLIRRCGEAVAELGFEACLTSRPFTLRIGPDERSGGLLPGRGDASGADRVRLDLSDGLAALGDSGFRQRREEVASAVAHLGGRATVLVGPVRVEDRWCPTMDRLVSGEAWRYLIAHAKQDTDIICFDSLFGGFTAVPLAELAETGVAIVVEHSGGPPDRAELALRCLRAGLRTRVAAAGARDSEALRDGAGLAALSERTTALTTGESAMRLRYSLTGYALRSLRWASLLGAVGGLDVGMLALADLLRDTVDGCRAAHQATRERNRDALQDHLEYLASTADAITELCARAIEESQA